ncbi:MAG: hypothetical protein MI799_06610 [Desulfobacterales bacterium]|nr:hypothetical protein [Desulfobacterales bacterium]
MRYIGKKDRAKIDLSLILNAVSDACTLLMNEITQCRTDFTFRNDLGVTLGF